MGDCKQRGHLGLIYLNMIISVALSIFFYQLHPQTVMHVLTVGSYAMTTADTNS